MSRRQTAIGTNLLSGVYPRFWIGIYNRDGTTKNDCERNAAKRLLQSVRDQYPDRDFVVNEDALASNGPHIKELLRHGMDFILDAKEGNNPTLFDSLNYILPVSNPTRTM